jgi:hypothetical protein
MNAADERGSFGLTERVLGATANTRRTQKKTDTTLQVSQNPPDPRSSAFISVPN